MIIDIHAHVFAFPKRTYGQPPTTFMSIEQQIDLMNAKKIDQAVILPLANPETPAEMQSWGEILYICEKYPGRFIPFCNIDPRLARRPDLTTVDDYLEIFNQCKALGFKGIGEVTARMPFDDPVFDMFFTAAEQVGFPIIFHTTLPETNSYGIIDEIGLPRFEKVLQRHPRLVFLGHSQAFWSEIGPNLTVEQKTGYPQGPVLPGGRLPELFRRYPQLNGDLSAGSGLNSLKRDPAHAYRFIEEFQDRLCLGLDYCSVRNHMDHIEWFQSIRDAGHISSAAYEKIMWQNANRLLHLNLKG